MEDTANHAALLVVPSGLSACLCSSCVREKGGRKSKQAIEMKLLISVCHKPRLTRLDESRHESSPGSDKWKVVIGPFRRLSTTYVSLFGIFNLLCMTSEREALL